MGLLEGLASVIVVIIVVGVAIAAAFMAFAVFLMALPLLIAIWCFQAGYPMLGLILGAISFLILWAAGSGGGGGMRISGWFKPD